MKMNFNLNLAQTQKLIMTPELKQAIEILQYNAMELNEFINEELLNNPILEKVSQTIESTDTPDETTKESEFEYDLDRGNNKEVDWEDLVNYFDEPRYNLGASKEIAEDINYDNFVADEESLKDFLLMQLKFAGLDSEVMAICEYIIENIDDNGYLKMNNEEAMLVFNQSHENIENMVKLIQTFDPPGVGARNIRECLLIQLYQQGFEESLEETLVLNHLEALGEKKFAQIAKLLEEEPERIQMAYDFIKTLEPKPGRSFGSLRDIRYVVPDVYVEKIKDEYVVLVNDATAPKLQVNDFYKKMLNQLTRDTLTSEYLSKNLQSALRIIKSIEQRRNTIARVCTAIVAYQIEFFEKGLLYLKPLNLKDIADEIEVHESTVSRAVNGKYIQCPNGLFEIKYFFQSGVKGSGGEGISSESVKAVIKSMVDAENAKKPLSDQAIADALVKQGINISRRTVAKYRDELDIAPSSKRKRF